MDVINLGATDGLPAVSWANVVEKLDAGSPPAPDAHNARTTWLSTVNEDGSPHTTAVGALWLDGSFWFQTGSGTRTGRNIAGTTAVERLSHQIAFGDRGTGHRAGRAYSLHVLTSTQRGDLPGLADR
jgi:hypothetical protein